MSSKEALKSEILKKAVVHGKVILSSGKDADYYVDLRRVTLDVAIPQRVDGAAKKAIEDFAKATNDFDPRKELFSKAKK